MPDRNLDYFYCCINKHMLFIKSKCKLILKEKEKKKKTTEKNNTTAVYQYISIYPILVPIYFQSSLSMSESRKANLQMLLQAKYRAIFSAISSSRQEANPLFIPLVARQIVSRCPFQLQFHLSLSPISLQLNRCIKCTDKVWSEK